jgi:hypothetical protein
MAARRTLTRTARGFRPTTDWDSARIGGALTLSETCNVYALGGVEALLNQPHTWMRVRGNLSWATDQATLDIYQQAYLGAGIGVAPSAAIASGSVPCPVSDANWDGWLWHSVTPLSLGALRRGITQSPESMIDSRAMRRLDDNLPFIAFEVITDAGVAVNFLHTVHLRFLLKPAGR